MTLIYLTNSMLCEDFDELNKNALIKANPSNQNFHNRLIRAFAKHHQVIAISYRPLATYGKPSFLPYAWKKTKRITYHYLPIHNRKYIKQKRIIDDGTKLVSRILKAPKTTAPLLIVDALNGTLRQLAKKIAKKYKLKTLAIVTDNPLLLSGANQKKAESAIKDMQKFDYYLPMTQALDILVNPSHKPHCNITGISEERQFHSSYDKPYLFFCGALHERYGINNLIQAFMTTDYEIELLIAGHGPDHYVRLMEKKDPRIKFLGQLTQGDIFKYESGALININPRPFDRALNVYSVPSKFFEYMTSGAPTMSTEHELLTPKYEKLVIWAGSGSPSELKTALVQFMALSNAARDRMAKKAKETVLAEFGIDAIGDTLNQFLISLR